MNRDEFREELFRMKRPGCSWKEGRRSQFDKRKKQQAEKMRTYG